MHKENRISASSTIPYHSYIHAHGLAAHVAPVRRHCYAAHRAGQQPARRCDAHSNVVLLPMAEQKESVFD